MRRIYIIVLLLGFILGLRFLFFYGGRQAYKDGQFVTFSTTLFSVPQDIGNQEFFTANLPNGEKVFIKTNNTSFNFGDNLIISGNLKSQLLNKNVNSWSMNTQQIKASSNSLIIFANIRNKISALFSQVLPGSLSSLLLGIVFGIKGPMSQSFQDELKNVGVLHVISASGMNVVMVSAFLSSIFSFFFKRQVALGFSILGIFLYAILAGLGPSIIRASIMGGLVFVSQILGRQAWASWGLFLSAFLMLFISPQLISDVSFQLSFAATAGLLFIAPIFDREGVKNFLDRSLIGDDVLITLCAQMATLPILLSTFGTYSLWSVVVNALVLWTIPPLMILGGIGAILGLIFAPAGQLLIYLTLPILLYFEKVVSIFGSGGVMQINNVPWQLIFGYYLMLFAILRFIQKLDF